MPVSTTYLIDPDIIPNYPFFIFEQTPYIIFFNILPSLTAQLPNVLRSLASRMGRLTWNWSYIRLVIKPTPIFTNVLSVFAFHQNPTCSPLTSTETRSLQTKHQFRKVANGSHHFFLSKFQFLETSETNIRDQRSYIRHQALRLTRLGCPRRVNLLPGAIETSFLIVIIWTLWEFQKNSLEGDRTICYLYTMKP